MKKRDNLYSILITILFHAAVLALLWFLVIKTVVPDQSEGGVLVNFGNVDEAAGTFEPAPAETAAEETQPKETVPQPAVTQPTPPAKAVKEDVITQEDESVAIEAKKKKEELKKKANLEAEQKRKEAAEAAEQKRLADEKLKKEQAISSKVAGAFGSGKASQGSAAKGSGNQGSPFGNSDSGANKGVGGYGSFNLNGRSLGAGLPRPSYTVQEEGRIVINIVVNPSGNVISAEIGRGTNIDNASMRSSALSAAKRAKFNSISGVNNQSGTITYDYKLK